MFLCLHDMTVSFWPLLKILSMSHIQPLKECMCVSQNYAEITRSLSYLAEAMLSFRVQKNKHFFSFFQL